jgi:hypothetical protein
MWLNIAAVGIPKWAESRESVEKLMTPAQIAESAASGAGVETKGTTVTRLYCLNMSGIHEKDRCQRQASWNADYRKYAHDNEILEAGVR